MRLVLAAADFAARAHADQRRKGAAGEPYVNHVIEVAARLSAAGYATDDVLLAGALLHDVLEDTPTTRDALVVAFGDPVAALVAEVTDDKTLPRAERKRLQIETAPHKSERARLIKIADKTSNVRAMASSPPADWNAARKLGYVAWAEQVVAGLRGVNETLDAAFDMAVVDARRMIDAGPEVDASPAHAR